MAKSKQQKKRKQRNRNQAQPFFEAIPGSMTMPVLPSRTQAIPQTPIFDPGDIGRFVRAAASDFGRISAGAGHVLFGRRVRAVLLAMIGIVGITGIVVASSIATSTIKAYGSDINTPASLLNKKKTGVTILDRNGVELYSGYGAQSTKSVALSDVPQTLKDATLAIEDPSFYTHPGFSWKGTIRAAWVDLTHGSAAEGGSTLTQQLVKTTLLTSNKTIERKYQELLLSMQLEKQYSKDQIFEMYLNAVYYGQGATGASAASQTYFHLPISQISLSQAALLAALPQSPSRLDPTINPEAAKARRDSVLDRMASLGKITAEQEAAAKLEPITVYEHQSNIRAPHFVFYILDQLREQYGEAMVEDGGITVKTTLDITKQDQAQAIVADQISRLSSHHVTNGGLVSMVPSTGDIIAMVGSIGYDTPGYGNVNVTLASLQPGSSFKPIVYLAAFEKGWNGATTVEDKPLHLPGGDGTVYSPLNYDLRFRGTVTLRRALANSLNIPAIETLQYVGIPEAIQQAKDMGITTLTQPERYGLALVLGGAEVRPIDMATVYGVLANNGVRVSPRSILAVTDRYGNDITKAKTDADKRVAQPEHTAMITNILSDNAARTEEFGANSPLKLSRPAAAKTGTTNDFRDNWTVGYTPSLVTAVWVGNNDHSAMQGVDGITGAAPIWHNYMEMALAGTPIENFIIPATLTQTRVCSSNGGIANAWDTNTFLEYAPITAPITKACGTANPAATPAPTTSPSPTNTPASPVAPLTKASLRQRPALAFAR